jgi:two-component system, NarL family, nitrate/nitrite response regulator NarL
VESFSRSLICEGQSPPASPEPVAEPRNEGQRTIVVSDVRLYREGLAIALKGNGAVHLAGTAADYDGALDLIRGAAPTVILLDWGMPYALELARRLLLAEPSVRVVGVAVNEVGPEIVACAEAGLTGYVPREGSIDDTISAIIDAMHNELHCSPRITAALFRHLSHPATAPVPAATSVLTPREVDVVQLIERGMSNKEIGQRLRISTATVKNHVHNLLEKLKVGRRAEAAAQLRQQRPTNRGVEVRQSTTTNAMTVR